MPPKDFQRDLGQVRVPGRFKYLSKIRAGDGDGSVCFTFTSSDPPVSIDFQAVAEPQKYPKSHEYLVYSTSDEPPPAAIEAVEIAVAFFPRISLHGLLTMIQSGVCSALNGAKFQPPEQYQDGDQMDEDDSSSHFDPSDLSDLGEPDDFDDEGDHPFVNQTSSSMRQKVRQDLRALKESGFRVGYFGDIAEGITISAASRLNKLGIPEEATDVWKVHPNDYLVLLLRYPRGYLDMQDLFKMGDSNFSFVQVRLGLCDSYKPSATAAVMAFQGSTPTEKDDSDPQGKDKTKLRPLFIGNQLNSLLNDRFMGIVRLRLQYKFSWTGAEHFFHASQGKYLDREDAKSPKYLVPDEWGTPPPPSLMIDHMAETDLALGRMSFPLLAMQFTLRHFVKCTEFCLVCFCKKNDDFEALKPYVCSNRLCLYQYITYGMGPSLEHEIKSQPGVVDLLVSLAYTRAHAGSLADFPNGLGIRIPIPNAPVTDPEHVRGDASAATCVTKYHSATLDPKRLTCSHGNIPRLVMKLSQNNNPPLAEGHWILIEFDGDQKPSWHCRVQHVGSNYVEFSLPLRGSKQMSKEEVRSATKDWKVPQEVKYTLYDKSFDELSAERKRMSILMLLSTLPGIDDMIKYLESQGPDAVLSSWQDRIPPAALDLMRWIVASNRSCILQDDSNPEHLVGGMKGYIQFRLVQGAPDKEQRFIKAVNANSAAKSHPTLFAWHGSAVHNWHSILREGLHFKHVVNGRSRGHGVYMANHFQTSMGYSGFHYADGNWPQSNLNITSVISLNEVVNAPKKFVCTSPYVVQHLNWIQPRYLFVGTGNDPNSGSYFQNPPSDIPGSGDAMPATVSGFYAQDPSYRVLGPSGTVLNIPISAISAKRRKELPPTPTTKGKKGKKSRKCSSLSSPSSNGRNGFESDATDIEDLKILLSDSDVEMGEAHAKTTDSKKRAAADDETPPKKAAKGKKAVKGKKPVKGKAPKDVRPATEFVPGTLQEGSLPVMPPPQYATSFATKILQKQFQSTVNIQKQEKLHELGWYVDPNLISGNLYQWIVELHSFDAELPLAKDMKAAGQKSVVLELRFPPSYPMDPPFVRVIRPRFLEFNAGGGGHVTLGGAMCMELLTNSGWTSVTCMESLLLQVRLAITSTEPRPARLAQRHGISRDYAVGEAVDSYKRACNMHGWKIPKDLELMRW